VAESERHKLLLLRCRERRDLECGNQPRHRLLEIRAERRSTPALAHPATAVVELRARPQQRNQELWILEAQRAHKIRVRHTGIEQRRRMPIDLGAERAHPLLPARLGDQPGPRCDHS
jgi:hypothetical protein